MVTRSKLEFVVYFFVVPSHTVEPVDRIAPEENHVIDDSSCPTKQTEPGMHAYQDPSIVRVMLALSMTMHARSQMMDNLLNLCILKSWAQIP